MTLGVDHSLGNQNFVTNGAVLAFRQASCDTGRYNRCVNDGGVFLNLDMARIVGTDALVVCSIRLRPDAVSMVRCGDILNILGLDHCPRCLEGCGVGCGALLSAACGSLHCAGDGATFLLHMVAILRTHTLRCTATAIRSEGVGCSSPVVSSGRDVIHVLGLGSSPGLSKISGVSGRAHSRTARRSLHCAGDSGGCGLFALSHVFANTLRGAGLTVLTPRVSSLAPLVAGLCDILNILGLDHRPRCLEGCGVGCGTLLSAACGSLHCAGDSGSCGLFVRIVFTNTLRSAGLSILRPSVSGRGPKGMHTTPLAVFVLERCRFSGCCIKVGSLVILATGVF